MLKKLLVNGKKIPVPIPLATVKDAMVWLEQHLLAKDQVITKVQLGEAVLELATADLSLRISTEAILRVTVETPEELSYKMVDAVPNLISVVAMDLKPTAVKLWQSAGSNLLPEGLLPLIADLHLIADLTEQSSQLALADGGSLKDYAHQLKSAIIDLKKGLADGDLRQAARILLTAIEPNLSDIDNCFAGHKDALEQLRHQNGLTTDSEHSEL